MWPDTAPIGLPVLHALASAIVARTPRHGPIRDAARTPWGDVLAWRTDGGCCKDWSNDRRAYTATFGPAPAWVAPFPMRQRRELLRLALRRNQPLPRHVPADMQARWLALAGVEPPVHFTTFEPDPELAMPDPALLSETVIHATDDYLELLRLRRAELPAGWIELSIVSRLRTARRPEVEQVRYRTVLAAAAAHAMGAALSRQRVTR